MLDETTSIKDQYSNNAIVLEILQTVVNRTLDIMSSNIIDTEPVTNINPDTLETLIEEVRLIMINKISKSVGIASFDVSQGDV